MARKTVIEALRVQESDHHTTSKKEHIEKMNRFHQLTENYYEFTTRDYLENIENLLSL